ncbi:adhesion G protein-coupled receptor G3 isoform X1 [Fukomys damarensis]|uniref:adhesion G protein-coupled receptor G3 isoform X1 n=1 Tax=Fukomys damarensis TaxID=885580 RepID=UPI001455CCA5|nr:adhesion G protein-coupled receptor G3 isoform X1 [Fukomys damarensis]
MAPPSRKKEATGRGVERAGGKQAAEQSSGTEDLLATGLCLPRMETPRVLWALLLLLLSSSEVKSTTVPGKEEPRNPCQSLLNKPDPSDLYYLNDTSQCFAECRQAGSSYFCAPGNLERHWLHYESYLVENSLETVDRPFVKSLVQNISIDTSEDLLFSLKPCQIPRQVMKDEDKPSDRVRLPKSFFGSLPGNRSMVRLAITVLKIGSGNIFKGPRLLQEEDGSVLNNHVVGLSVGQAPVTGLSDPLEIVFSHQHYPPNMTLTCMFWDVTQGPTGDWASRGCSTQLGAKQTVCSCNHLTFFALLLRPILDRATVEVLTRISQAGCGVSMIFLIFAIILYIALRLSLQRFKSEDAPKIHVSLSSSLFLLNLTFLVSMGSGLQGSSATCWARGAVFHYCLLCTFTWMGLEAFHLYLLSIRVFNTYFSHYFLKLSLAGWGLPALVVIGTGSANSYGLYAIRDQENRTSLELCWFQNESALYATVHGYFFITFLFGAVVLALVAWKIFTLSSATAGKERGQKWKAVLTVLGLSSLVGMTWGLAILTPLGPSTIYIFAFFNSLQGVFIFCWFTILYFPSWSTTSSSGTTARLDQAHSVSHE